MCTPAAALLELLPLHLTCSEPWTVCPCMEPDNPASLIITKGRIANEIKPLLLHLTDEVWSTGLSHDFSSESLCNLRADWPLQTYFLCIRFHCNYSVIKENSSIIVDIFHFQSNHTKQFCLSALLGFCLNGLTIISFRKIKELRTPSNLLVLSIALADCGICINAFIAAFSSFLRYGREVFLKLVQKNHMKINSLSFKRSN